MKKKLIQHTFMFLLLCTVAVLLTFLALRLFFNGARLDNKFMRQYYAKDIQILAGQARKESDALLVNGLKPEGISFVNVGNLYIDRRFYETLVINFGDKRPQNDLLLAIRHQSAELPAEKIIPQPNDSFVTVNLNDLLPSDVIVADIGLLTDRLAKPYQIKSFVLQPKQHFTNKDFLLLLWDCFAINKQWGGSSINSRRSPHPVFISPKILVMIVFTFAGVLFLIYLHFVRVPKINAWWATIVAAWLTLDIHYLAEKTVITQNTYDTFAHLSDDEKDLVLSPQAAKLAQTIKSVLPNDGKPKKIRIQPGWEETWLSINQSHKRYLNGKLKYYLLPHAVYMLGTKAPEEVWKAGGFYFADVREKRQRLAYHEGKKLLRTETGQMINAERLLSINEIAIYSITGEKATQPESTK